MIGLADTGIDDTSCYFADSNGAVPRSTDTSLQAYPNQRVVIQYAVGSYGDSSDISGGHGTFVAGTLAGQVETGDVMGSLSSNGMYDGVAPHAKIAFMDISNGGESVTPPGSAVVLYGASYSAGARVHSNSWGSTAAGNAAYNANDLDSYLYANPVSSAVRFLLQRFLLFYIFFRL